MYVWITQIKYIILVMNNNNTLYLLCSFGTTQKYRYRRIFEQLLLTILQYVFLKIMLFLFCQRVNYLIVGLKLFTPNCKTSFIALSFEIYY